MAYSRRRSTRSAARRMSGNARGRKSTGVRARRPSARRSTARRSSVGGTRTVRLVIEQAAPTVQPVVSESGAYVVPDKSAPKRSKF